jgi:zinc finger MYM-type protein 2/3/4
MDDYDKMVSNKPKPVIEDNCAVCSEMKTISIEVIEQGGIQRLCSGPCFAAFKFANNIVTGGLSNILNLFFTKAE